MDKKANLSSRGIAAVFWGTFGSALRAALQIGTQIVLARLLGPAEYGIFAIASIVLSFSKFFSDVGISYGLIQKKTVSDNDIRFVFTWQLILGLVVALAVFALAGPLAAFFNEPRMVDVLRVAPIICFINALASPSMNLLKRELDFKSLQAAQVIGYLVGYVLIGIPMAAAGMQVWALIAAFISSELLTLILLYHKSRHPIGILFWQHGDSHLLVYGVRVFATNVLNWIIGNVDRVVIGRMFPTSLVGLYSVSYNLMSSPTVTVITVVQSALFSTSSRVQDDFDRLRKALLTVLGAIALLLFPVFAGMAVVSETILLSLYGESWVEATEVLRAITLAMPLYLLIGMATPLLWVSGHPQKEFNIQVPIAIGFVIAAVLAAQISLEAVAWTVFGMYLIRALTILSVTCRALGLGIREMMHALSGGAVTTTGVVAAIYSADLLARRLTDISLLWLAADIAAGALAMLLALGMFPAIVNAQVAELFEKIATRLPSPTNGWIQKFLYRGQLRRRSA